MSLALALLVVGVVLILIDLLTTAIAWLLWVGVVLAVIGLVLLFLDRSPRRRSRL